MSLLSIIYIISSSGEANICKHMYIVIVNWTYICIFVHFSYALYYRKYFASNPDPRKGFDFFHLCPTHPMPNFPMVPQHFGYFPNVNQTHTGSNQLPMFSSPYSQAYNPFVQPQPAPNPNPVPTSANDQPQAGNSQEKAEEQHDLEDSQVMEQEEASQEVLQESAEVIAEADIHPAPVE